MKKVEVNCDACEKDLRYTSFEQEAYITMLPTYKAHPSSFSYSMNGPIPITRDFHFCNWDCLKEFLKEV